MRTGGSWSKTSNFTGTVALNKATALRWERDCDDQRNLRDPRSQGASRHGLVFASASAGYDTDKSWRNSEKDAISYDQKSYNNNRNKKIQAKY